MKKTFTAILAALLLSATSQAQTETPYHDQYRPQIHFSPMEHWMNDPNGLVYEKGTYHLFYQYYPGATVWGPMHWGHATSTDLIHWKNLPIALYPDKLGYIFSGSAVVDKNNTSGFGKNGKTPLVAIFTHHDPEGEKAHRNNYQNESIAYSIDDGKTWTKYSGNPVLKNPGLADFRDPKVSWYEPGKKWIMTLATHDHITFFSSPDLKTWSKESEFGKDFGAHGGVWECPDLFPLTYEGKTHWVLLVSINPGGVNTGSATQYFIGRFDGKTFTPYQTDTRWIDYGPDDYAGVTWSNTGSRKIFLGWMSNWQYGTKVPTVKWRSAMTIPRELSLQKVKDKYLLVSQPVKELSAIEDAPVIQTNIDKARFTIAAPGGNTKAPLRLDLNAKKIESYSIILSNEKKEKLIIGYDLAKNEYYIDRSASGKVDFEKTFGSRYAAPRLAGTASTSLTLVIDDASVELFADNGLTVMTAIFFPSAPYNNIEVNSQSHFTIDNLQVRKLNSIWSHKK